MQVRVSNDARRRGFLQAMAGITAAFLAGCATIPFSNVPRSPAPPAKTPPFLPAPAPHEAPPAVVRPASVPPPESAPKNPLPPAVTNAAVKGTPPAPRAPVPVSAAPRIVERVLAVQIGLDRQNFSPGCLDGRMGSQTRLAIEAWQAAKGLPVTGAMTEDIVRQLDAPVPLASHTVTVEDRASLAYITTTWPEKASQPYLGYETILEMAAERFHASEACIRKLNPDAAWPDPPPGTIITGPNPEPAPRPQAVRLEVNLSRKYVRAYDVGDVLVAHFPCSIARLREKRPQGQAAVVNVAPNPTYTFDPALFSEDPEAREIPGKLILQAGPNNPVGVAWVGLDLPGYGIHGAPRPEEIGKTESHGCIRLANWNARKLLRMVRPGCRVDFVGDQ